MLTHRITPKTHTQLERRHKDRRRTLFYLKVSHRDSGKPIGQLVDISPDGMLLISGGELPLHSRWPIRIHLPGDAGQPDVHADAEIETRWEKSDSNPCYHCTGCQILTMQDADRERLDEFSRLLTFEGINAETPAEP